MRTKSHRSNIESFSVLSHRSKRCTTDDGARTIDTVDLAPIGCDQHVIAERADRVKQNASHSTGQTAGTAGGDENIGSCSRVVDVDNAVAGRHIDISAWKAAKAERTRDKVLGRGTAARN